MRSKAQPIELTIEEKTTLDQLANSRNTPQGMAQRAKIVLLAADGLKNTDIACQLQLETHLVGRWRNRFRWKRLEGLQDEKGRGRKRLYSHDVRFKIITKSCETPPEGTHWTVRELAKEVNVSKSTVNRILHELDLKPWKVEEWLTSYDPEFEKKAAEICGLYLNPPENALVVSVDEKTGIQALGRVNEDKPERPGSPRKQDFEYIRHGTACLFAAFVVHDGKVIADVKDRHTANDFIDFLDTINSCCPKDKMIHLIVDNFSAHKTINVKEWFAKHGRFVIHFTPTHASWINQVEMWFSILARRLLKHAVFDSKEALVQAIMDYIRKYNEHSKPFRWTYDADPLRI